MKHKILTTLVAILLLPAAVFATTMSSPNYAIDAGHIVSGGSAAAVVSGMSKVGIAIGQGVFIPPDGVSSPSYAMKPTSLPTAAAGGSCGIHSGDINCDGAVNIIDALLALKSSVGLVKLSSVEITRGDVGPLVKNVSVGDGRIDIEDSILILRKAVGLGW